MLGATAQRREHSEVFVFEIVNQGDQPVDSVRRQRIDGVSTAIAKFLDQSFVRDRSARVPERCLDVDLMFMPVVRQHLNQPALESAPQSVAYTRGYGVRHWVFEALIRNVA